MQVDISPLFQEVLTWVTAGVAGIVAWVVRSTAQRLKRLEDCSVKKSDYNELKKGVALKEDLDRLEERAEKSREELRQGVVSLFDKVDELKTLILRSLHGSNHHRRHPDDN